MPVVNNYAQRRNGRSPSSDLDLSPLGHRHNSSLELAVAETQQTCSEGHETQFAEMYMYIIDKNKRRKQVKE